MGFLNDFSQGVIFILFIVGVVILFFCLVIKFYIFSIIVFISIVVCKISDFVFEFLGMR